MLWRFLQVGYPPDVAACEAVVARLVARQELSRSLRARLKDVLPRHRRQAAVESGERPARAVDIARVLNAVGTDLSDLPLLRMLEVANDKRFFEDRSPTGTQLKSAVLSTAAELDRAQRIAFRWYRYETAPGALAARFMARALDTSFLIASEQLRELHDFNWRTSDNRESLDEWAGLYMEGTFVDTDIRLVGPPEAVWEVEIASSSFDRALEALRHIVAAVANACPDVPQGGVSQVVTERLASLT